MTDALISRERTGRSPMPCSATKAPSFRKPDFVTLIGECTNDAQIGNCWPRARILPPELKPFLDALQEEGKAQEARRKRR